MRAFGSAKDWKPMLKQFWQFVRPHRFVFFAVLAALPIAAGFAVIQPYLVKLAIDEHILNRDFSGIQAIALVFLAVVLGEYAVKSGYTYGLQLVGQRIVGDMRRRVYAHLLQFKMSYFDEKPTGVLLSRTVNDVESLGEALASGVVSIFLDILVIFGTLVMMLWLSWTLSLGVLVLVPILWLVIRWFSRRLKQSFTTIRHVIAELNAFLDESISGLAIIQLFRKEKNRADAFQHLNRRYCDATVKSNIYDASLYALVEGIAALCLGGVLWVVVSPWAQDIYTAGLIVAFMEYLQKIFLPIKEFSSKIAMLQRAAVDLDRIFSILNTREVITSEGKALAKIAHTIRFDRVSFRYRAGNDWVLRNVSLTIPYGQSLAIVGATGSGKTTLIKLLLRHYEDYRGAIWVDGHELREIRRADLHRRIHWVPQDVFLFDGSIRENIALDRDDIDANRVAWAAQVANAAPFIERYPDHYQHRVSERGANISAGEAQLLAFARALAGDGDVIVLDEATAAIDSETEHAIEDAIAHILAMKSTIVIAHRLSTLRRVDRIVVMKDGRIVEDGTHSALMALKGDYYCLYRAQED